MGLERGKGVSEAGGWPCPRSVAAIMTMRWRTQDGVVAVHTRGRSGREPTYILCR